MTGDERAQDLTFMRMALEEASRAPTVGEVPIAALIVQNSQVLAQTHNYRELWQDPTAHAEVIAIRAAAIALGTWRLTDTTLYVTVEPCSMCIGAIILARISRVVFGAWDPKAGACGSVFDFTNEPRLNHHVEILGGLLEQESQALIQQFFRQLRTG
ncbi:MAG TPA: tRNA adenosine(34) deaminase TadA [Nitrospiraceae bacterium]|nr:tRNA adenosine(34) deaminase TadA [Nitrospiraceae bacterium]